MPNGACSPTFAYLRRRRRCRCRFSSSFVLVATLPHNNHNSCYVWRLNRSSWVHFGFVRAMCVCGSDAGKKGSNWRPKGNLNHRSYDCYYPCIRWVKVIKVMGANDFRFDHIDSRGNRSIPLDFFIVSRTYCYRCFRRIKVPVSCVRVYSTVTRCIVALNWTNVQVVASIALATFYDKMTTITRSISQFKP